VTNIYTCNLLLTSSKRYEIADGAPGWADAERQVQNATKSGQKNVVVSVKSLKKRKTGETAAEIYEQELGEKVHKKAKKGFKKGHS
jgi:N-acetyltransferase 10